jgi:nucleotide-binding universal stress UspA family protein
MTEIVVGLDLSPAGAAALRWAAEQARRTGVPLRAVHAATPYQPAFGAGTGVFMMNAEPHLPERYRQALADAWDQVQPEPDWQLQFFLGDPGSVLTEQAADALLLVVGTHFHVGLGRVFPGSVSHYCLSHARVPVVAVPAAVTAPAADQAAAAAPAVAAEPITGDAATAGTAG